MPHGPMGMKMSSWTIWLGPSLFSGVDLPLQREHLELQRAYEEQRAVVRDLEDRLLAGIHIASPFVQYAQARYDRASIGRQNASNRCKRLTAEIRRRNVELQESLDLR